MHLARSRRSLDNFRTSRTGIRVSRKDDHLLARQSAHLLLSISTSGTLPDIVVGEGYGARLVSLSATSQHYTNAVSTIRTRGSGDTERHIANELFIPVF